ncbi:hypothetical protein ACT17_15085 [Mycolicibacterium conceptionense]|uniref:Uncharacterized protein n=1 Tax=Mycolicibacterium conceptionense TaxID=451644 RepID=A0A0J8U863_9MYCO|nr:hypothetical protein [Mycolicibacterium conceptionense]KMV17606.1 hypothetical protein ACT17_15085 [Mycolicibacterium conceptionense]
MAIEIDRAFTGEEYARGYVCDAPDKNCSPHITVNDGGVWFRTSSGQMWRSAHRRCLDGTDD